MALNTNSDSRLLFSRFKSGFVGDVLLTHSNFPGFVIPLVSTDENANANYTISVDSSRHIDGFVQILESGPTQPLDLPYQVEVGQPEIFAIVNPDGKAVVGTKRSLRREIVRWISKVKEPLLRLNFAIFCEADKEASSAAQEVIYAKTEEYGDISAALSWFSASFVCSEIAKAASYNTGQFDLFGNPSPSMNSPPRIEVNWETNVLIYVDQKVYDAIIGSNKRIVKDLRRVTGIIAKAIDAEIKILPEKARLMDASSIQPTDTKVGIETAIKGLKSLRPQEVRLAALIDILISQPEFGRRIIHLYNDSSKYTNMVVHILRTENMDTTKNSAQQIELIVSLLPQFFRMAYPQQRGKILISFAEYLGKHDDIANCLRELSNNSSQREVVSCRSELTRLLRSV